jgi:hypothetical protein
VGDTCADTRRSPSFAELVALEGTPKARIAARLGDVADHGYQGGELAGAAAVSVVTEVDVAHGLRAARVVAR